MTSDANAGALDAGLDAALVFAEISDPSVTLSYLDKLLHNAVDKAFPAKTSTVNKGIQFHTSQIDSHEVIPTGKQLILKLMEISDPTSATNFLISKLNDKKPKIPPTCLEVIRNGITLFGIQCFPVKEIIKSLSSVFNGTNGPAREAAMALIVEIHRWVGLAPLQVVHISLNYFFSGPYFTLYSLLGAFGLIEKRPEE